MSIFAYYQNLYRDEDKATDNREERRSKDRKVELPQEEIEKQGEELYTYAVKFVKREYPKKKGKLSISCKLMPNCVFNYVVNKFKEKGWGAKHTYNDGYNAFDWIEVTPPKYDPTECL